MRNLFLSIILFVFVNIISAQVTQEWVSIHQNINNYSSSGNIIKFDNSGNIVVAGESGGEIVVIKYSNNGTVIWTTIYPQSCNGAVSLAIDNNNNIYVITTTTNESSRDILTIKFNPQGTIQWVSRFSNPGYSLDLAVKVIIGTDGYVYVLGDICLVQYEFVSLLIKYNASNGDSLWTRIYYESDDGRDMVMDSHNNIFIAGWGLKIIKCNSDGKLIWETNTISGAEPMALTLDKKGNLFVTGDIYGLSSEMDCITAKYDSTGTTKWVKTFTTNHYDWPYSIAVDDSSNVFIAGFCTPYQNYSRACLVVKYNTTGTKLWEKYYLTSTNYDDRFLKIVVDKYGNCYATGSYCYSGPDYHYIITRKYSKNGDLIWSKAYTIGSFSETRDLIIDSLYNIYVTGYSPPGLTTIKYSQIINISLIGTEIPSAYSLSQNYPNPFNPTTKIKFDVMRNGNVKIMVYDIMGREVQTLVNESLKPGTYEASLDGSKLNSGVYFYKLITDGFTETKKMLLIK
ncbi:MAG: T9SS type A sorting domain-containing protein [Ignavibacteriae bacterium]|nr:T9SS type A sorting domain-containing protein [Ignavibacteriota bacterium]